jgi:catechol 2,3-dioxygenase-like lactoylglutathione lyase family enzyme
MVENRSKNGVDVIEYALSHFGICVSDLDRALRFYCDGLGFDKAEVFEVGNEFASPLEVEGDVLVTSQFIRRGGAAIELLHYATPGVVGTPSARRNQLGITHLSFIVADIEAAIAHLVTCGGTVVPGTRFGKGDPALIQIVFLADPDGTRVELMQYPAA